MGGVRSNGPGAKREDGAEQVRHQTMIETTRAKAEMYESRARLPFKLRAGGQTAFDHTSNPGTVILGVEQLPKLGITSQREIDFIVLHELGHFYELSQDPEGYRSVIDEGKRSDGLGQSYFRFYNALLDIYVNRNTCNRAPDYGDGKGGFSTEIHELYTTKLFRGRNLTSLPKSTQYSYALLNTGMGVGGDLVVSPEVQRALDDPLKHNGRQYTTQGLIERYLVPAIGIRSRGEWRATVSERKSVIDKTFRKRFEALVEIDKEEGRDPNQGSVFGDLEGVEASVDDLDQATRVAEQIQREANKSPDEKAADGRKKAVYDEAKEHLSAEQAQDLAETYSKVYPQILQVVDILKEIVRKEIDYRKTQQGFFTSGQHLDNGETVERIHTVQTNPSQARVFKRDVYEEVVTEQPQHVRIWAVFDLSGSMDGDIQLVRELSVIFAGAVRTLSLGAELEQHPLRGSFAAVGYSDDAFEILPLKEGLTFGDIAESYGELFARGGTYEAPALGKVVAQLANLERDESVVDIVVAVTDGETAGESESRVEIQRLKDLGAKLLAFKFGRGYVVPDIKPDEDEIARSGGFPFKRPEPESGTFGRIWGEHGQQVRNSAEVVPAVRSGLSDLLKKE